MNFDVDIYELGLTSKTLCALNANKIFTIGQLVSLTHSDLAKMKGIGESLKADIMQGLKRNRLHLGMK